MLEDRVLRFERAKSVINIDKFSNISGRSTSIHGNNISMDDYVPTGSVYYPHPHVPAELMIPFYSQYDNSIQHIHKYQVPPQVFPPYPTSYTTSSVYSICPSPDSDPESAIEEGKNKIFVSHLNGELVTQRKLLRHFQRHGHITDIELFKNNLDGTLRQEAFAFISYLKPEQMFAAINAENGREWLGKTLKCFKALKKKEKNLDASLDSDSGETEIIISDKQIILDQTSSNELSEDIIIN